MIPSSPRDPASVLAAAVRRSSAAPLLTCYDDADRRAGRAVGHDAGQLGGQDRQPAAGGVRRRPRQHASPWPCRCTGRPPRCCWACGAAARRSSTPPPRTTAGWPGPTSSLAAQDRLAAAGGQRPVGGDDGMPLLGLSLHPLGLGMRDYAGSARDFAVEVRTAGDVFAPWQPVDPDAPGLLAGGLSLTLAGLVETARELPTGSASPPGTGSWSTSRPPRRPDRSPGCWPRSWPAPRSCCAGTPSPSGCPAGRTPSGSPLRSARRSRASASWVAPPDRARRRTAPHRTEGRYMDKVVATRPRGRRRHPRRRHARRRRLRALRGADRADRRAAGAGRRRAHHDLQQLRGRRPGAGRAALRRPDRAHDQLVRRRQQGAGPAVPVRAAGGGADPAGHAGRAAARRRHRHPGLLHPHRRRHDGRRRRHPDPLRRRRQRGRRPASPRRSASLRRRASTCWRRR